MSLSTVSSGQWSKERLDATVNVDFIRSRMVRPQDRQLTDKPLDCGVEGFFNASYGDWVVDNAKSLFLLLVQIGAPALIFEFMDHGYDDGDLPLRQHDFARVGIPESQALQLNRLQKQMMGKGHAPRKAQQLNIDQLAIEVLSSKKTRSSWFKTPESVDTVRIMGAKSRVYTRRGIAIGSGRGKHRKDEFMRDIQTIKRQSFQHIVTLRTAYFETDSLAYVLLTPALNVSLQTFLTRTPPKSFKSLPTYKQHEHLFNWPHCLAGALSSIHRKGLHHGQVVPSNIFVDSWNRVYLGFSVSSPSIQCHSGKDFEKHLESYCAPECVSRWSTHHEMLPSMSSIAERSDFDTASLASSATRSSFSSIFSRSSRSRRPSMSDTASSIFDPYNDQLHSQLRKDSGSLGAGSEPAPSTNGSIDATSLSTNWPLPAALDRFGQSRTPSISAFSTSTFSSSAFSTTCTPDRRAGDVFSLACVIVDIVAFVLQGPLPSVPSWSRKTRGAEAMPGADLVALAGFTQMLVLIANPAGPDGSAVTRGSLAALAQSSSMLAADPGDRPGIVEVLRGLEDVLLHELDLPFLHCGGGGRV